MAVIDVQGLAFLADCDKPADCYIKMKKRDYYCPNNGTAACMGFGRDTICVCPNDTTLEGYYKQGSAFMYECSSVADCQKEMQIRNFNCRNNGTPACQGINRNAFCICPNANLPTLIYLT